MIADLFRKLTIWTGRLSGSRVGQKEPCGGGDRYGGGADFISALAIGGFYSGVWFIFSNWFSSRRDESLSYFLYRLRGYCTGGIWTSF